MLSASEIAALQEVGHTTLISEVKVYRESSAEGPEGDVTSYSSSPVLTLPGWLVEVTPATAVQEAVGGVMGVPEVFQLYVPPDSDVRPADQVTVDGSMRFTVEHTNDEDTYRLFLNLTLRKLT
jgi:hypothetical protein